MKKRVVRNQFTDEEKKALLAEYTALPVGTGVAWLKEKGLHFSMISKARQKFGGQPKLLSGALGVQRKVKVQPKAAPKELPVAHLQKPEPVVAKVVRGWSTDPEERKREMMRRMEVRRSNGDSAPKPTATETVKDFKSLSDEEKTEFLKRYDHEDAPGRRALLDEYQVTTSLVAYHRQRRKGTTKRQARYTPEQEAALAAEYETLAGTMGTKGPWLKAHGMSHQMIHDLRKRTAMRAAQANGHKPVTAVAVSKPTTVTAIPAEVHASGILLSDGINYLQIKRDIYAEVIEDLKRVLSGQR